MNITTCSLSENMKFQHLLYVFFMIIVLLSSAIGNILVTVSIFMSRCFRERVGTIFIISLACSDFANAAFLIPFKISTNLRNDQFCHSISKCFLYIIVDSTCNIASIFGLLFITIDRYIAIRFPFHYTEILTRKRAKIVTLLIWIVSAVIGISGIFQWQQNSFLPSLSIKVTPSEKGCRNENRYFYVFVYFALYLPSLGAMTILYLVIMRIAVMHAKAIALQKQKWVPRVQQENLTKKRGRIFEMKTTKTVAMVYLAFIICWGPSCVINIIIFFDQNVFPKLKKTHNGLFKFIFYSFIEILPVLTTTLNPFIYSFSNKHFRSAFKKTLKKLYEKISKVKRKKSVTSLTSIITLLNITNQSRKNYIVKKTSLSIESLTAIEV
ncbi:alpha-2B adrenergic receptor [Hydra vulgaris]|uniref:alpha-2B adrenergic receptor n=1 Tax=Hydra vulgaris TaxID=6087 RepID=UPI001F5F31AE|nr:alpha-2B adrenergic receptor [Hydra vulgaris]